MFDKTNSPLFFRTLEPDVVKRIQEKMATLYLTIARLIVIF